MYILEPNFSAMEGQYYILNFPPFNEVEKNLDAFPAIKRQYQRMSEISYVFPVIWKCMLEEQRRRLDEDDTEVREVINFYLNNINKGIEMIEAMYDYINDPVLWGNYLPGLGLYNMLPESLDEMHSRTPKEWSEYERYMCYGPLDTLGYVLEVLYC